MEDYQKIIENGVTNGRRYDPVSYSKRNSELALQAQLADMDGQNWTVANELLKLDDDLQAIGISDLVSTPEQVGIALAFKNRLLQYIQNTAFTASRFVESGALERILTPKYKILTPKDKDDDILNYITKKYPNP